MTFDEDLKRAFDALSDRLHAEVRHQIEAAMAELQAAAPAPPPEPPPLPPSEPAPASADTSAPQLVAAVRKMDESQSLTDVLDALATAAADQSGSVAVRLRRGGELHAWRTIGANGDAIGATRHPLVISGEEIGELCAQGGSADALEILARHASRCLESLTAFKTARALARQAETPRDESLGEEDVSAQRYAKLLVSEIKLYHEADVLAGRRERDLASRLGGEIARARVLYDQRVAPHVRQRADYFHDELVRTLADGDATLLEFHA